MSQAESRLNSLYRSVSMSFRNSRIAADVFERSGYIFKVYTFGDPNEGSMLITTGVHGDERNLSILPCLTHAAQSQNSLPHITFIDFANPSSLRTLHGYNPNGFHFVRDEPTLGENRGGFYPGRHMHSACHSMVKCIESSRQDPFEQDPFDLSIDLHGDYGPMVDGRDSMKGKHYVYDSGDKSDSLLRSRVKLLSLGIHAFQGKDTFTGAAAGSMIRDGYIPNAVPVFPDGSLQSYMIHARLARRAWTVEVPVQTPEFWSCEVTQENVSDFPGYSVTPRPRQPIKTQTAITHHILQAGIETVRASR